MISRIGGIGYIDPRKLIWVSELSKELNMGQPICSFKFQIEHATQPFQARSHIEQPNGMWAPTTCPAQVVEDAHRDLIRAWEAVGT